MKWVFRALIWMASLGFLGAMGAMILMIGVVYKYGQNLPDFSQLKDYRPPVVTRVHAGDGRFLAEFAQEKRIFVPVTEIPDLVKHAFISAEDQNFYKHQGIDPMAIARAAVTNVVNRLIHKNNNSLIGASTITQQVTKNFLLTNKRDLERKIKEAILSVRMEQAMSKDRLLELYLNQIFLGQRSYGVAAASLQYFNKTLDELTIPEVAYLAALPKAPNNYHPEKRRDAAIDRRNWVIGRMAIDGYITKSQADIAKASPLLTVKRNDTDVENVNAPYFAEEVRRELVQKFGEDGLYQGGLSVRTSVDPKLQNIAETALQKGLSDFDHKRGWRGPVKNLDDTSDWKNRLISLERPEGMLQSWSLAMVLDAKAERIEIGLASGTKGRLRSEDVQWTSNKPLRAGDIIMVEDAEIANDAKVDKTQYQLKQVPQVQGALIALDPNTGRVLAMQGGWKFDKSEFNRATQAQRQPGSAFKPFIYLAALDKGYTPSSIIVDGPIEFRDALGRVWRPENYSGEFYGPTPLRVGVEKSRNLMTIRLAQEIGIDTVVDYAKRFGINENMAPHLANSLGSTETTPLKLTAAYGMIVNGGKKITPTFIDRVQDRYGKTIEQTDHRPCAGCGPLVRWESQLTPEIPDTREQVGDPRTAYQMVTILEGVVQRGTAKALSSLEWPLAGKTGTTNDSKDAWFVGFTPDLVVGVFIGYDEPKSLGDKATGGSLAVPVFKDFMERALKDTPPVPFRIPPGVRMVQVNAKSGQTTYPGDPDAIWEPFLAGTEPNNDTIDYGSSSSGEPSVDTYMVDEPPSPEMLQPNPDSGNLSGTGGIY